MCIVCDFIKKGKTSTKNPLGIRCYWTDMNSPGAITSDLTKCEIEVPHPCGDGSVILVPVTNCPCCGDPIVFEKCNTLEEVLQREG